jgi:hypothetical protein
MSELPLGYDLRELTENDFNKGYLQLLEQLTTVGSVSLHDFKSNFCIIIQ